MPCLLTIASLSIASYAQQGLCGPTTPCVTTWHNDYNRTGWQPNETILTADSTNAQHYVGGAGIFGLLWQWPKNSSDGGYVYAQPLAVSGVNASGCQPNAPCDLVFVATEGDWLYAFQAEAPPGPQNPVWSTYLPNSVPNSAAVDCNANGNWPLCAGEALFGRYVGVTGTPVIDVSGGSNNNVLYVAAALQAPSQPPPSGSLISYYLFAVDITSGNVLGSTQINGSVNGSTPSRACTSTYPQSGQITFDNLHIQRSALLLLDGQVYVAFADLPETENGWLFAYSFNKSGGTFGTPTVLATTPYGTGGGIWGSGAGPASDGTYIYLATGNGTLYDPGGHTTPVDAGDTLLRLDQYLSVWDWYAPSDAFSYQGTSCTGRCACHMDFGSGGVLLPNNGYTYNGASVVINADKESNLYVANRASLGHFSPSGGNNIQVIQTPLLPPPPGGQLRLTQGYWASPAYWSYKDTSQVSHYMLYYAATVDVGQGAVPPFPINAYALNTSGTSGPIPITQPPALSTDPIDFCHYSPTPSGSWDGSTQSSGILWAIEANQDAHNQPPNPTDCSGGLDTKKYNWTALHAFDPVRLTELYTSRYIQTKIGHAREWPVPTIFNGFVYFGTDLYVEVFGLCTYGQNGQCEL